MKKLILLCSFELLGSFAFGANEIAEKVGNESHQGYKIEFVEDATLMCCNAVVTYNGQYQTHYTICGTAWNCEIAEAMAWSYVDEQGG